jgi:HK97 gp10 family phage protein
MANDRLRSRGARHVSFEGEEELKELFRSIAPELMATVGRQAVFGLASEVAAEMKNKVKKRSGRLFRSIKAVRRRGSKTEIVSEVRGGDTAPYMLMLEFGTSKTKAQPFIVPTVEQFRPKVADYYKRELGEKLEKSLRRKRKA